MYGVWCIVLVVYCLLFRLSVVGAESHAPPSTQLFAALLVMNSPECLCLWFGCQVRGSEKWRLKLDWYALNRILNQVTNA